MEWEGRKKSIMEWEGRKRSTTLPPGARKRSIVEVAEAHFDKNTIILSVNVLILIVLVAILYVIATSAMNVNFHLEDSETENRH